METKSKNIQEVAFHSGNWNDTTAVFYFVTLSTKSTRPYLGATQMGSIANRYWLEIPDHFPFVELDHFSITSSHVRGILFLNKPRYESWRTNSFKPQSENLASVIRNYKDSVKKYAVSYRIEFDWQVKHTAYAIRSEIELNAIRQYINSNKN